MNLNEEVELLKGVPILSKIEPAKLKLLAFTSERVNYAEGQEICHQGDPGDAMYVILGGVADVLIDTPAGQIQVSEMNKNDFFGEIAILCDVPRTATVQATTRLVALRVSKDGFFNLVTQFPQIAVEIMGELASRLHATTQRLTEASARLRSIDAAGRA